MCSSDLSPTALTQYASAALMQGGIAAYGSYAVGKAAQHYLEGGCSWGTLGVSRVIEEILNEMDCQGIALRLHQEISNSPL